MVCGLPQPQYANSRRSRRGALISDQLSAFGDYNEKAKLHGRPHLSIGGDSGPVHLSGVAYDDIGSCLLSYSRLAQRVESVVTRPKGPSHGLWERAAYGSEAVEGQGEALGPVRPAARLAWYTGDNKWSPY